MAQAGKDASPAGGAVRYARHRPETTLLYQLVNEYYPAFADQMTARGTPLPEYVQREFEDYLKCGRLEYGFLRIQCESALVPKPRVNLTRFHGVFAPNSQHRALVTKAGRGKGRNTTTTHTQDQTPAERHVAMTWAQRLKRVFGIDIETCQACGSAMKVIACIEDPRVICKILDHLDRLAATTEANALPEPRAPPQAGRFDLI